MDETGLYIHTFSFVLVCAYDLEDQYLRWTTITLLFSFAFSLRLFLRATVMSHTTREPFSLLVLSCG